MATKKYLSLERLTEYDDLIKGKINEGDENVKSYVDIELAKKAAKSHEHDAENISIIMNNGLVDPSIVKNDLRATIELMNIALEEVSDNLDENINGLSGTILGMYGNDAFEDENGNIIPIRNIAADEANDALEKAKSYTDTEVAKKADATHTHDDRYYTESEIDTKLSSKSDTGHEHKAGDISVSMSHTGGYIEPGEKEDLQSIVQFLNIGLGSVSDSLDATAKQFGDALLGVYGDDALMDDNGKFTTIRSIANDEANTAFEEAKDYTDEKIANLLDNSTEAVDSIMELADAMKNNADAIDALQEIAGNKVDKSSFDAHTTTHAPSDAQANVIETIKVNGTALTPSSKSVNITVPTKASDIGAATDDHTHTVDSALSSSSTNPVENKVVNSAIVTLTSAIAANTDSITAHSTAISNLQTAIGEIQEITSAEIQALFSGTGLEIPPSEGDDVPDPVED